MKCCKCNVEMTTQDAMAGQLMDTDEGTCHIECLEPGDTMIEPKCAYDLPVSPEVAERQAEGYRQHLLAAGFADGRTARQHEAMEQEEPPASFGERR